MVIWVMTLTGCDGNVMYLLQNMMVICVMSVAGCDGDVDDVCYRI